MEGWRGWRNGGTKVFRLEVQCGHFVCDAIQGQMHRNRVYAVFVHKNVPWLWLFYNDTPQWFTVVCPGCIDTCDVLLWKDEKLSGFLFVQVSSCCSPLTTGSPLGKSCLILTSGFARGAGYSQPSTHPSGQRRCPCIFHHVLTSLHQPLRPTHDLQITLQVTGGPDQSKNITRITERSSRVCISTQTIDLCGG